MQHNNWEIFDIKANKTDELITLVRSVMGNKQARELIGIIIDQSGLNEIGVNEGSRILGRWLYDLCYESEPILFKLLLEESYDRKHSNNIATRGSDTGGDNY